MEEPARPAMSEQGDGQSATASQRCAPAEELALPAMSEQGDGQSAAA